jgi:hypothetical protein
MRPALTDVLLAWWSQGLPFGGIKNSGFGRFAGVEGLRALCYPRSVAEDRFPWLFSTSIPRPWLAPIGPSAVPFAVGLTTMFYGPSLVDKARGVVGLMKALTLGHSHAPTAPAGTKKAV